MSENRWVEADPRAKRNIYVYLYLHTQTDTYVNLKADIGTHSYVRTYTYEKRQDLDPESSKGGARFR